MKSKKALAIVLAIAMLFGVVSVASAATSLATNGFADSADSKQAACIDYLKAFNVLRGDAGTNNVRPNDPLNREEFVAIVVRATGHETLANGLSGFKPNFTDAAQISDWAVGAVNFATGQGWIKGYEDGAFRPKGNLTVAEAVTVWVRATGHETTIASTAVWPVGHVMVANTENITAGVELNLNAPITREDMARLTCNSLHVRTASRDANNNVQYGASLAEGQATIRTGRVTAISVANQTMTVFNDAVTPNETYNLTLADEVTLIGANTLAAINGLSVRTTAGLDGKVFIIEVREKGGTANNTFKAAVMTGSNRTGMELADGTKFSVTVDKTTNVTVNGARVGALADPLDPTSAWITFADATAVHNFLGNMKVGDEVVATVEDGVALSIDIIRLDDNAQNYVVLGVSINTTANATHDSIDVFARNAAQGGAGGGAEPVKGDPDAAGDNVAAMTIAKSAPVYLNGERVTLADLSKYDVVNLAVAASAAPADGLEVLKVVATRDSVTGVVAGLVTKVETGGTREYLTIKLADGTTRTLPAVVQGAFFGAPAEGTPVAYLVNGAGQAVRAVDYVAQNVRGKILALWSEGGVDYVDVDVKGQTVTYVDNSGLAAADLGKVGTLSYTATGVTTFTAQDPGAGNEAKVTSILEGGIVIYQVGNNTPQVVVNPLVYKANADFDAAGDYLGLENLQVGDTIKASANFVIVK